MITSIYRNFNDYEGSIKIGGKEIKEYPLKDLRNGMTIIPQDPYLFEADLKTNLDPMDQFSKEEMKTRGIMVCRQCHNKIHKTFPEKVLGREYNTLEALQSDERIQKFISWVVKQR